MKSRYAVAIVASLLAVAIAGCSQNTQHTDKQAAMARMTFSPEKCEQVGAVYYTCAGEHSLPDAGAGMVESGSSNDTQLIRGTCPQGTHYDKGNGCQPD